MSFFSDADVIFKYTSNQAVEDGILTDLFQIPSLRNSRINLATTNLLQSKGYMNLEAGTVLTQNIRDLLIQCLKKMSKTKDTFYNVSIEFPDGSRGKVFIVENETGYFTVMLPEDN